MSYYAEMQKQSMISQLALCVIVVSIAAITVAAWKLWGMGVTELREMAWPLAVLAISLVGAGFGFRTRQASIERGEMVRTTGGRYALNTNHGTH